MFAFFKKIMLNNFIYFFEHKEGACIIVYQNLFVRFVDVEGNWVG